MIKFHAVSKVYANDAPALRDISLEINSGELIFLAGPSGAGKSTLLKLIAGIEKPNSGTVSFNGQDIGKLKSSSLPYFRRRLGLILQDHALLADRNILENVMLPMTVVGASANEAKARALVALERVNLAGRERQSPLSLSGGEQQRVAIARAIVNRPEVILADEPTAFLDKENAQLVISTLKAFQSAGVTCIISSHDDHLFEQSSRVIFLNRGSISKTWESAMQAPQVPGRQ